MKPVLRLTIGALAAVLAAGFAENRSLASARSAARLPQEQQVFPTAQRPLFRAGATLVAVDAYPLGPDGNIREGLTPADFDVTEDGKPQSVELFEFLKFSPVHDDTERHDPQTAAEGDQLAGDPRHRAFVAYFDSYNLTTYGTQEMRQPVVDFLNRSIGASDYFAAMNPDTPPAAITFGQRTETLAGEIAKYFVVAAQSDSGTVATSAHEQWLQACYGARYADIKKDQALVTALFRRWREDLVLSSLTGLTARLASIREERTNVILFADGWTLMGPNAGLLSSLWHVLPTPGVINGRLDPNGETVKMSGPPDSNKCDGELTRLAEADFNLDFRKLREAALRRNVAFYPVSPAGLEVFGDKLMTAPQSFQAVEATLDTLRTLATTTNGTAVVRTNDIRTPLKGLSDAFGSYYLLGYYTTNPTLDGKYRTIDVKVKAPGVKVTARHGYIAAPNPVVTSSRTDSAGPSLEATALGTLSVNDSGTALVTAAAPSGTDIAIVAEVTAAHAAAVADGADVKVTVKGADGAAPSLGVGRIDKNARSAIVRVPVGGAAAPWHVQVDVGAPSDGLSSTLEVPARGSAIVGEPLVFRATPSPRSPLWPSATRLFTRNDRVHIEWALSGALDNRTARLLDRRGQPLAVGVTLAEPPGADHPALAADLSLAPLAPGDYLVELVASRGGASERHLVAIRVQ